MTGTLLTAAERTTLHDIARAAIRDRLLDDGALARALERSCLTPALLDAGAAFVTLKVPARDGDRHVLRGCIGTVEPTGPLHETVARCACESAFADPRFPPLTAAELDALDIEISVLGALRAVDGPEAIVPGLHGVVLDRPGYKSLFLPQVATEQGWGVTPLLEHLALKAGLQRDGWHGARLSVFEAEVF